MAQECMYGCGKPGIIKNISNFGYRCSKSPNSCPGVKNKKKQALMSSYGVTNVSQLESIKEKKKQTWTKKYGVDNPSKAKVNQDKIRAAWPQIETKRKQTMLRKFGVDSYNKTEEFQVRRKSTWIKKYGVDNPTKNEDILHQAMVSNGKSEYRTRVMFLPSGKEIKYQGFENKVILDLLKAGIEEKDIINDRALVPKIKYTFKEKTHVYYPDIWIPKNNQIIEVKSRYTWKKYRDQNIAKYKACKSAGYNVNVIIR